MPTYNWKYHKNGDQIGNCIFLNDESNKYTGNSSKYTRFAKFRCVCGNEFIASIGKVRSGHTMSCGCIHKKKMKQGLRFRHGLTETSEYIVRQNIISRCYNPKNIGYKSYGGRGIKVCERWRNSFDDFYADMGKKPSKRLSIDRINVNGNYSCGHCKECIENGWVANCRWETQTVQARNTTRNRFMTFGGETKCLQEWIELLKISAYMVKKKEKEQKELLTIKSLN